MMLLQMKEYDRVAAMVQGQARNNRHDNVPPSVCALDGETAFGKVQRAAETERLKWSSFTPGLDAPVLWQFTLLDNAFEFSHVAVKQNRSVLSDEAICLVIEVADQAAFQGSLYGQRLAAVLVRGPADEHWVGSPWTSYAARCGVNSRRYSLRCAYFQSIFRK